MTAQDYYNGFKDATMVIESIEIFVEFVFVLVVTAILLKKRQLGLLPAKVKMTLVLFWAQDLFIVYIMICHVLVEQDWGDV